MTMVIVVSDFIAEYSIQKFFSQTVFKGRVVMVFFFILVTPMRPGGFFYT